MLRPARSGVWGLTGEAESPVASCAFMVATREESVFLMRRVSVFVPTPVEMCLLREIIVRVTISVDGAVQLLKGHESMHQLVVGM